MATVARGVRPAIEFLPHFVASLRLSGSATAEMLSSAWMWRRRCGSR